MIFIVDVHVLHTCAALLHISQDYTSYLWLWVKLFILQGMDGLNNCEPRKIQVLGPYTFNIGDISQLSDYVRGGIATQVKMPTQIDFVSIFLNHKVAQILTCFIP